MNFATAGVGFFRRGSPAAAKSDDFDIWRLEEWPQTNGRCDRHLQELIRCLNDKRLFPEMLKWHQILRKTFKCIDVVFFDDFRFHCAFTYWHLPQRADSARHRQDPPGTFQKDIGREDTEFQTLSQLVGGFHLVVANPSRSLDGLWWKNPIYK